MGRFGSLTELKELSFFSAMIGVPLLLLSIIWGAIWGHLTIEQFNYLDAKVVSSIIVIIFYSFFLYAKVVKKEQGKNLAFYNVISFLVLLINIFLSRTLSEFHWW